MVKTLGGYILVVDQDANDDALRPIFEAAENAVVAADTAFVAIVDGDLVPRRVVSMVEFGATLHAEHLSVADLVQEADPAVAKAPSATGSGIIHYSIGDATVVRHGDRFGVVVGYSDLSNDLARVALASSFRLPGIEPEKPPRQYRCSLGHDVMAPAGSEGIPCPTHDGGVLRQDA